MAPEVGGVVDEHVAAAGVGEDAGGELPGLGGVGEVHLQGLRPVDARGGLRGAGPVGDEHPEPVPGQPRGARAPDSAGSPGDQSHPHAGLPSLTQRLR